MQGGRLLVDEKQSAKPRNGQARFVFADGPALLLTEAGTERRAGVWCIARRRTRRPAADRLGPEALDVTAAVARRIVQTTNMRIHGFLRDQHEIAGLGRMLANEVCHRAKISPFAMTGKLGADGAAAIVAAIHEAVEEGLAYERTRPDMSSSKDRPGGCTAASAKPCPVCGDTIRSVALQRLHGRLLPDVPDRRQGARRQHHVPLPQSRGRPGSRSCRCAHSHRYARRMPIHLRAEPSDYAPAVLVPGDPRRATYIAETFFDPGASCVNEERGMLGYTGTFKGRPISVQSVGMGVPSAAIYYSELIQLGVKRIIRVGTAGGIADGLRMADTVVAISATPDDPIVGHLTNGEPHAPTATWPLIECSVACRARAARPCTSVPIVSSALFYDPRPGVMQRWKERGHLAVEMEAAVLYTLGAIHKIETLCMVTISDIIAADGRHLAADQRRRTEARCRPDDAGRLRRGHRRLQLS